MRREEPFTQVTQKAGEEPAISLCGTSSLKHMRDGDLMGKAETNIPCKLRGKLLAQHCQAHKVMYEGVIHDDKVGCSLGCGTVRQG